MCGSNEQPLPLAIYWQALQSHRIPWPPPTAAIDVHTLICPLKLHPHKQPLVLFFLLSAEVSFGFKQTFSPEKWCESRAYACCGVNSNIIEDLTLLQQKHKQTRLLAEGLTGGGGDVYSNMALSRAISRKNIKWTNDQERQYRVNDFSRLCWRKKNPKNLNNKTSKKIFVCKPCRIQCWFILLCHVG